MSGIDPKSSGWTELSFVIDRDQADALSDALLEAGALSVQVLDNDAGTDAERPVFGEPGMAPAQIGWHASKIVVLCDHEHAGRASISNALHALSLADVGEIVATPVAPQDWVSLTQSQFEPTAIGDRLWITPSWHAQDPLRVDASGSRETIVLDPGLAFGTGSHPTTRLCLAWLDRYQKKGMSVIDYGCGSGILAIAAAKLGAATVHGVDIDPQALRSAQDNAHANAVTLVLSSTAEPAPPAADIVVANILASPLKVLAPLLEGLVRPGGHLVLAGLLDAQIREIADCYNRIELRAWASEDGWTCLAGQLSEAT